MANGANESASSTKSIAPGASAVSPPLSPVTWADYRSSAVLLGFFLVTMALAIIFSWPFKQAGLVAVDNPESVGNAFYYFGMLMVFTFVILFIAKKGKQWMIQVIILGSIASTIMLVVFPVLGLLGVPINVAVLSGLGLGIACSVLLWKYPEWFVIDFVGVLVAAAASAILGISLSIVPVLILLVALAIYDAIAVYKTKHMLTLADTVMGLKLPVLVVVPKVRGYSYLKEGTQFEDANESNKEEREAMFMGLGDLVMPTILVISALHFGAGWGSAPALGAAIGTLVGYSVLMGFVLKGNPQAGLPLLNGGAIVGFLTGVYAASGSLVFW